MRVISRPLPASEPVGSLLLGRAATNTIQTMFSAAWTNVVFGNVTDAGGGAMTSTRFTAPSAGVYDVSVLLL